MVRDGVARLTLEAAAAEAGLSKGGVLYHFPTRDALVAGMVVKIIEEFDRDIEAHLDGDAECPGAFTRAYIRATMDADPAGPSTRTASGRRSSPPPPPSRRLLVPAAGGGRPVAGPSGGRRARPGPGHRPAAGLRRPVAVRPVRSGPAVRPPSAPASADRSSAWPGWPREPPPADRPVGRSRPDRSARLVRTLTVTIFLQWMGASSIIPMLPGLHPAPGRIGRPGRGGHGLVLRRRGAVPVPDRPTGRPGRAAPGAGGRPGRSTAWPAWPSSCPSPPRWPSCCAPCRAWAPGRPSWPPWPWCRAR